MATLKAPKAIKPVYFKNVINLTDSKLIQDSIELVGLNTAVNVATAELNEPKSAYATAVQEVFWDHVKARVLPTGLSTVTPEGTVQVQYALGKNKEISEEVATEIINVSSNLAACFASVKLFDKILDPMGILNAVAALDDGTLAVLVVSGVAALELDILEILEAQGLVELRPAIIIEEGFMGDVQEALTVASDDDLPAVIGAVKKLLDTKGLVTQKIVLN